jgi:hypothetical protein
MEYLIGVGLALSVSLLARIAGLDRDRAFYPTVMIVIASYHYSDSSRVFHFLSSLRRRLRWD